MHDVSSCHEGSLHDIRSARHRPCRHVRQPEKVSNRVVRHNSGRGRVRHYGRGNARIVHNMYNVPKLALGNSRTSYTAYRYMSDQKTSEESMISTVSTHDSIHLSPDFQSVSSHTQSAPHPTPRSPSASQSYTASPHLCPLHQIPHPTASGLQQ